MHKTQVQMDQRPQHKTSDTEPYRRESGKYTLTHWHREPLPKYNPSIAQILRETINKWDLLKLRSFCKAKEMVNKLNSSVQNGKRSSPAPHQTEV